MTPDPNVCEAFNCTLLVQPVGMCREKRCCYR